MLNSQIRCAGLNTDVLYSDQHADLALTIVEGDGPTLLGCDWLKQLRLNWKEIFALCQQSSLQSVLDHCEEFFQEGSKTSGEFTKRNTCVTVYLYDN